jgi:hypothetical protein
MRCWGATMTDARPILGRAEDVLPTLPAGSVDLVLTDPPYPCVKRSYGTWTEPEWWALMRAVVPECVRVLKPAGSAVFILQPNSERVGRMRTWLWDFLAWVGREWGIVQDVWWWNPATPPTVHCHRARGLMRPSVKACAWVGLPDCHRDQDAVLWAQSPSNAAHSREDRVLHTMPGGLSIRRGRACGVADERGGVTPFNLLPIPNSDSATSAGANGHGAGTPLALCDWWVRYACPPDGTVLDPFTGSGTVGVAARHRGRGFVGIECVPEYVEIARKRLRDADGPLFARREESND